jgi:hypothetical protein
MKLAFKKLKNIFTSTPLLHHFYPDRRIIQMEARRISILLAPGFPPHSQASTRHIREALTIALREQDRGPEMYRHIALLSKVMEAILATTTSYITETFHLLPVHHESRKGNWRNTYSTTQHVGSA